MERSWRLLEPKKVIVNRSWAILKRATRRCQDELPGGRAGPAVGGWEPVGGDLGESIPKGIDVGLCEALVKSKQPGHKPLRSTAAHELIARWPDLTGGCAPETGHLADSMPEAEILHDLQFC